MLLKLFKLYIKAIYQVINKIKQIFKEKSKLTSPPSQLDKSINYNSKYVKKEYLLTQTELKFYKLLKIVAEELDLVVCPQIPLYEIVNNIEFKDFNKIQSKSIDFVITEKNLKIKLCIELDDYSHKQEKRIKRDEFVNKLFDDLNIKLIRVPVQNFYNLDELKSKIKESL